MSQISDFHPEVIEAIDPDHVYRSGGRRGVWDREKRLAEMNREGVAAEVVFPIDHKAVPLFFTGANRKYAADLRQAGVRAYHRWVLDTFGGAFDRMFVAAEAGPCIDMNATIAETTWAFESGLHGVMAPGSTGDQSLPPPYHPYFDRLWSLYEEAGGPVYVHAGYGIEQGEWSARIEPVIKNMEAAGRTDLLAELLHHVSEGIFPLDLRPRQFMWQMMFGGVFDRHPNLRIMLCEIRGDWIPDTLWYLDAYYERNRHRIPALRKPSEYFAINFGVVLSFVHKSEVGMFEQIGLESVMFGRDYPHAEGTWPNTSDWLCDSLQTVPDPILIKFLGENAVRLLGLDGNHLAEIAAEIGPTCFDVNGRTPDIDPRCIESWDQRGGYLKPPEIVDLTAVGRLVGREIDFLSTLS